MRIFWLTHAVAASLSVAMAGASGAAAQAPPRATPFFLPKPTGRLGVGTTSWFVVDSQRQEPFSPAYVREVKVTAWYPASTRRAEATASYLRETPAEASAFAALVRQPGVFDHVADVVTNAVAGAPLISRSRLPLLLFSHGFTAPASAYTALLEDLASHGFVVLSVVHPYEAVATLRSDDSVVTMLDANGAPRQLLRDVFAEWASEDSTMARVTRAPTDDERLRILREYFAGLSNTQAVIDRWVADLHVVLADFRRRPDLLGVARAVDWSRLGVFGHSMGGVVAGQFCVEDERCKAGLNLDGIPQSGVMIDRTMSRPFLMVYSTRPGRLGANDVIYRQAASAYQRVDVDGTLHLDFSDLNFWGGPLRRGSGTIAPARAAELTRTIVREYFDQELNGRASALLRGSRSEPEVRVHPVQRRAQ